MTELMHLTFQGQQIRMVVRDGEPWWVARDVCDVLEIGNPSAALGRLDEDEKGLISVETPLPEKSSKEAGK